MLAVDTEVMLCVSEGNMPNNQVTPSIASMIRGSQSTADSQPSALEAPPSGGSASGSNSKYAGQPDFEAWRKANPGVPEVVQDGAFENSKSRVPPSVNMPMSQALTPPVDPYQNLANKATGRLYK